MVLLLLASVVWMPSRGESATLLEWNGSVGSWFDDSNWTPAQLPASADAVTIASGTAIVNGPTAEADTVNLSGTLQFDSASNLTFSAEISGNGQILKSGSGETRLTGSSSAFTGTTTVEAGTLFIDEGGALFGDITVESGATLSGDGLFENLTLESGSTLIPIECLDGDSLTWHSGATLIFGLGDDTFNRLDLSDSLNKAGVGTSYAFTFQNYNWNPGEYTLIIFGSENGFSNSDFSFTNSGGFNGIFDLQDDRLIFTLTSVPEPSSALLLSLGLAAILLNCRRKS